MTNERARTELEQLYMSLSEEKKQALDVLMAQNCDQCEVGNPCLYCEYEFKAQAEVNAHAIQSALDNGTNTVIGTAQADNIPVMYYPQVDGITPTVVAQADGEKTCGTCRNEDTYHCAECENKSDYEQSQADGEYIKKSDMIDWLKDIRHKMKPQNYHTASEFEIAENQIWNLIQMLQMGAFPTVVIPSAEPKTGHWIERKNIPKSVDIATANLRWKYECSECEYEVRSKYHFCPNCGADMRGEQNG